MIDTRPCAWHERAACALLGLASLLFADVAAAQDAFPAQSIEIVVPFGAGGGADLMAKKMGRMLERVLGVPLFVSNIPGASGNAGLTKVLVNPPDGYTLAVLVGVTVSAWAAGIGYARLDDFSPLAIPQESPSMLFVPADSPFKTFRALLDYAKNNPGKIKVATAGYGSNDDLALRYFDALGYRMVNVPYARPQQRYASSFGKRTQAIYEEPGDVAEFLASKRLRPLVVFDSERHPAFQDVPSSKELGFEVNDLPSFRVLIVRAGTPPARQAALAKAISEVLATTEWKTYCTETHTCARGYTPDEATKRVKSFFETSQKYLKHSAAAHH